MIASHARERPDTFTFWGAHNCKKDNSMTTRLLLAASILAFAAMNGEAFAYSNVSQRPARPETTSSGQSPRSFKTLDQEIASWTAAGGDYRYHGGPKSND
jgi:hypothetical protein